jgi:flavodoxin
MHSLVVYYSKYGNTRRVAEAIAAILAAAGDARAASLDSLNARELAGIDLLVLGSPTHYQNVPKEVRAALEALPDKCLAGKKVAVFDTSMKMWGPIMRLTAAHRLVRRLRRLGGKTVAKAETFLVVQNEVPEQGEVDLLAEGELERAGEWAASILARMEA